MSINLNYLQASNTLYDDCKLIPRTNKVSSKGTLGHHRLYSNSNGQLLGWMICVDAYNNGWAIYDLNKNQIGMAYTPLNNMDALNKIIDKLI